MTTHDIDTATLTRPYQRLRQWELSIIRRLDGLLHGQHLGLQLGQGNEPAEAREYQPGQDDVRMMDWALTARTTTAHVRDHIADRELESWTLLDMSASMNFGTTTTAKRDLALGALAAFTALTQRGTDRLGLHVLHQHGLTRHATRCGPNAIFTMLRHATRPPTTQTTTHPPLAQALDDLNRRRRRRGLRLVISDFLDTAPTVTDTTPEPDWETPINRLTRGHQLLAVEILDPRELDLPDLGWMTLRDPETGRVRDVYVSARVRRDYHAAALARRHATQAALRHCGAWHLVLRTDRDWLRDIASFVAKHRRLAEVVARPAAPR